MLGLGIPVSSFRSLEFRIPLNSASVICCWIFFFNFFFLVTKDGRGYFLSCYISPPFCFPVVIVLCRCCCLGSFLYQPLFLGSLNWQTLIVFICCDEICNGRFFNFQSNSDQKCNKGIKMKV
jgi:hypothetical protein